MREKLSKIFEKYNIKLNELQISQFEKYYNFLIEENKKYNLTAITDEEDVIYKHFLDSVLPCNLIPQNATLVDVGSGAGFPAVPLKILRPDLQVTMVDSLLKRVVFLQKVIKILNFDHCFAVHSRAEDFAKQNREKFDVAVARAVAPLNTLCEYMLPLVKIGGVALVYKSQKLDEEILCSKKAIKSLGASIENIKKYQIQQKEEIFTRNLLILKKTNKTPAKYPRPANKPKTNPIK